MGKSIKLNILSPGCETITEEILSLSTTAVDGSIQILSNYAPSIIAIIPTISTYITMDGSRKNIFTSTGIIYIKDNIINLCCDSVNLLEEIDLERARRALERAEERLSQKECNIDIERAKRAKERAKARLKLK